MVSATHRIVSIEEVAGCHPGEHCGTEANTKGERGESEPSDARGALCGRDAARAGERMFATPPRSLPSLSSSSSARHAGRGEGENGGVPTTILRTLTSARAGRAQHHALPVRSVTHDEVLRLKKETGKRGGEG